MKIITWNVNGIRAVAKKGLLEFMSKTQPDILCLQETKAHPDQIEPELMNPFGYTSHWSAAQRPGYSGTVTYVKATVNEVKTGIGIKKFDSEGRFVVTRHPDFLLYNVYFPNGSSGQDRHLYKQEFLKKFTAHLEQQIKAGNNIVLVGDYNVAHADIDVYDPEALANVSGFLPIERQWFSEFLAIGFTDLFRHFHGNAQHRYTWWNYIDKSRLGNRGWRLDYVCVTHGLLKKAKSCEILDDVMGSDHCPVLVEFD